MAILWSMTATGKIYRATDKNEIPDGAFMFSLDGEILGQKGIDYTWRIPYHPEHIEKPNYHTLRSYWNDLLN